MLEQFTLPPNTEIIGAANPNDPADKMHGTLALGPKCWDKTLKGKGHDQNQ